MKVFSYIQFSKDEIVKVLMNPIEIESMKEFDACEVIPYGNSEICYRFKNPLHPYVLIHIDWVVE